jgi:hypothetical protein
VLLSAQSVVSGTVADELAVTHEDVIFEPTGSTLLPAVVVWVDLSCTGSGPVTCVWSVVTPVLAPGPYRIYARGTDGYLNHETPGAMITATIV